MIRKQFYFISICIALMGCHKVSVDFSYAPAEPKTGEKVTFTNLSSNGEDYTWDFGDNRSASTKSATHTYSKAGTYVVTLREKRTKKTCQRAVTVTDSLLSIGITEPDAGICRYDSVPLKAQVWNPFSHEVTYRWYLDKNTDVLNGGLDEDSIVVIFKHHGRPSDDCPPNVMIRLEVTMDGQVYTAEKEISVYHHKTWSLLYRTSENDYYQLVYPPLYDLVINMKDAGEHETIIDGSFGYSATEGKAALDGASPTLTATDRMEQKVYQASGKGLTVSNLNGSNEVVLTADSVGTILMDSLHQRLFYTTADGVYALPLIYSPNNQSSEKALRINELTGVTRMLMKE